MIISNSSPIINLGKQGILDLLGKCFDKIIIPFEVYEEIMKKENSLEAVSLKKGIDEGWINMEKIAVVSLLNTGNLGQGEKEAISLAYEKNGNLLIDDETARKYASLLNVECHGTIYALYICVLKKLIDKRKARKIFENMIRDGFYVSSHVYGKFLDLLEKC